MNVILRLLAGAIATMAALGVSQAAHAAPANFRWESFGTDQIVVRMKDGAALAEPGRGRELAATLSSLTGQNMRYRRTMGDGSKVLRLRTRLPLAAAEALAKSLARHGDVREALPDRILFPALIDPPDDPQYASQWSLGSSEGIRALQAWDITTGSSLQVVAVVDTGILGHPDLDPGRVLAGYDFVAEARANDGDGRDVDPTDPGDWISAEEAAGEVFNGCPVGDSSWHGTVMAGIISARTNNAAGVAGINWNTKILPVRAVGKCGGYASDIADGIRWAAGLSVVDIPGNPNPADVINVSLAVPTAGSCDVLLQAAINEVVAMSIPVVVAAGNQAAAAAGYSPGNCAGVINVGAVLRDGGLPSYANFGSPILLSAPGGTGTDPSTAVLAPADSGLTLAANDGLFAGRSGTSIAAAHVTGVVSLIQSVKPALTPAEIRDILKNTTRAFPGTASTPCTTSNCGRGILDAHAAVQAALAYGSATPSVSAGSAHSGGVRSDGTFWTWGAGNFGKLGDNNTVQRNNPVQVHYAGGGNFIDGGLLALGGDHSLATRPDTTAWSWGLSTFGRLGDGSGTSQSGAVTVCASGTGSSCVTLTGVVQVAAGLQHSLALKNDGTVWAWGAGDNGQRGDGTTTLTGSTPVQVCGPVDCVTKLTGVVAIAAGDTHSLALKGDGTVYAWGANGSGRLGIGNTTTPQNRPVQVCDSTGCGTPLTGVVAIAGGVNHSLAVKNDGTAWAWGSNASGQLANPTAASPQTVPIQVLSAAATPLTGVAGVAAGNAFSLALKGDGTVLGWGLNASGQLGLGHNLSPQTYATAGPGMSNVARVAAAGGNGTGAHSLAIRNDGTVYAFGSNSAGQLGIAPLASSPPGTPVLVQASTGGDFTLQLNTSTFIPQLGAPLLSVRQSNTITISGAGSSVAIGVSAPSEYSIGCTGSFTTSSGNISNGQTVCVRLVTANTCETETIATLTVGATNYPFSVTTEACDSTPAPFAFLPQGSVPTSSQRTSNAVTITGINTGASISVSGGTYSIGCNGTFTPTSGTIEDGQTVCVRLTSSATHDATTSATLSVGGVTAPFYVTTVPSGLSTPLQVVGGAAFSAGLRTNGMLFLWGSNGNGQLGDDTTTSRSTPVRLAGLSGILQASAGFGHVLARRGDGSAWSWGYNGNGQLGNNSTTQRRVPAPVPGLTSGVAMVSAGFLHSLALKNDGTVVAWGYNGFGQLGIGSTVNQLTPAAVLEEISGLPISNVVAIVGGNNHSFALKADGSLWAWGRNTSGQLGDTTTSNRSKAVQVMTSVAAIAPGATADHAMVRKLDGSIWTWGRNDFGQLGNGCTLTPVNSCADSATPAQVGSLSGVIEMALGERHSAVVKNDQTVWTWGFNSNGQLASGNTTARSSPGVVAGLTAQKVGAGSSHTMAVRADGSVAAWGYNGNGQLGNGLTGGGTSSQDRTSPVSALGAGCSGTLNLDLNAAGFSAQTDVPVSTQRCSNTIAIAGIPDGSTITINSGTHTPEYQVESQPFTSASGTINNGQSLTLRQTSSPNCGVTTLATATVNGTPYTFSVATAACDTTPDAITFASQSDVPLSSQRTSGPATITGINTSVGISVLNGEYSIGCTATFVSTAGTVVNGDTVCVRHTSAAATSTSTVTTLTVGTVQATFTSTTAPPRPLTVTLSGSGVGTVVSTSPASPSINCGSACSADYLPGTVVTLSATAGADSTFTGWAGDCSGTGSCVVTMSVARFVVATFDLVPASVTGVKSRKTHAAGTFDLPIAAQPINGPVTVEPRTIGSGHRVVFQFNRAIVSAGTVTCVDANSVSCPAVSAMNGSEIEVTITGLADNQRVTVTLSNVDGIGASYSASLGFSTGDVDSSRTVTASDILRIKGRIGNTVDAAHAPYDTDLLGLLVGQSDLDAARANAGSSL